MNVMSNVFKQIMAEKLKHDTANCLKQLLAHI